LNGWLVLASKSLTTHVVKSFHLQQSFERMVAAPKGSRFSF
jgi:hypothetical protein